MPENTQTPTAPPGCAPTNGSESKTPRTDAKIKKSGTAGIQFIAPEFARQLERELEASREETSEAILYYKSLEAERRQTAIEFMEIGVKAESLQLEVEELRQLLAERQQHIAGIPNAGTQRPGDAEATNATRATPPGSLK